MKFLAPLLLVCLLVLPAAAQRIVISGQVVEATNGEPVPFASIFIPKTSTGVTADADGKFKLAVAGSPDSIAASAMGFATQRRKLSNAAVQTVLFRLKAGGVALAEVVVSSRQPENPAFRILREVQQHKPENQRTALQAAEYDSYNRIETSLIDLPARPGQAQGHQGHSGAGRAPGRRRRRRPRCPAAHFCLRSGLAGVPEVYARCAAAKTCCTSRCAAWAPARARCLSQMLGSNFQNFDFYPNWQNVLGKDFISPIAEGGRITYDYELQDSVFVGKDWCYKIAVTPKRSHDLAFKGTIWITTEGYALRRADLVASPECQHQLRERPAHFPGADARPPKGPGLPMRTKLVHQRAALAKSRRPCWCASPR